MGANGPLSNRRSWKYFYEKLAELGKCDVENIIARGRVVIEAHDELEPDAYEVTVKRHFDLSYARKLRIIAAHPVISDRAHVHALPPSVFTLYELTKLPDAMLREKLKDGSITPRLERKEVAGWRRGNRGTVTVDGQEIKRKSLAEKLKAAKSEIAALKIELFRISSGSLFDVSLDSAEDIGRQLADHMSEGHFDTAVKAAKASYKAKRQKPAG
jgi:hypothetical protein